VPQAASLRIGTRAAMAAEHGSIWLELGDVAQAEQSLLQARELYTQAQVEPSARMATALVGLARVQLEAGRAAQAEALLRPLVKAWEEVNPDSAWHGEALFWLSQAEAMADRSALALAHRQTATAMLRKSSLPALRRLVSA
jgi:tetratricopeptide (TPR) repeat protein